MTSSWSFILQPFCNHYRLTNFGQPNNHIQSIQISCYSFITGSLRIFHSTPPRYKCICTEGVNINPSSNLQPDICRRNINTITNNLSFIRTHCFHGQRLEFVLSDSHRNDARRKLSCYGDKVPCLIKPTASFPGKQ